MENQSVKAFWIVGVTGGGENWKGNDSLGCARRWT
jgi:hypothetical protein